MIYQKILTGHTPYHVYTSVFTEFPEHRHADFEFNFCESGCFQIIIEGTTYSVEEGCATFIPPMCAHEVPAGNDARVTTVVVGVSLLSSRFRDFLQFDMKPEVRDLSLGEGEKVRAIFAECALLAGKEDAAAELMLTGNVYKILAYFLRTLSDMGDYATDMYAFSRVADIDRAIELIHFHYKAPLTVESVACELGYSTSNFCKLFKKTAGEGFHQALNRHRITCAADLLTVSDLSVADIAAEVGFGEAKSFCRVFKSICGVTPGAYRMASRKGKASLLG